MCVQEVFSINAHPLDRPAVYPSDRWQLIHFKANHLGVMQSVKGWMIVRDEKESDQMDDSVATEFARRRAYDMHIVATMDRDGLTLNSRDSLSLFVPYPHRSDDESKVDAGDKAAIWLATYLGVKRCRLICCYHSQEEINARTKLPTAYIPPAPVEQAA